MFFEQFVWVETPTYISKIPVFLKRFKLPKHTNFTFRKALPDLRFSDYYPMCGFNHSVMGSGEFGKVKECKDFEKNGQLKFRSVFYYYTKHF